MGQFGERQTSVNKITGRLDGMENRLTEIEHSQQFIGQRYESLSSCTTSNKSEIENVQSELKKISAENTRLQASNVSLSDDVIDLKCRSMRDNLLFFVIPKSTSTPDDMWSTQLQQNDANSDATGGQKPAPTQQSQNGEIVKKSACVSE